MRIDELIIALGLEATPAAEAKATLEAKSLEKRDNTRRTITDLAAGFGFDRLPKIAKELKQLELESLLDVLIAGADFSHPETQGAIDFLASVDVITADEQTQLKAMGIWHVSPLENANMPPEISEADIAEAQQRIAKQIAVDRLQQDRARLENEGGINAATAIGDRAALAAAWRAAADDLEA